MGCGLPLKVMLETNLKDERVGTDAQKLRIDVTEVAEVQETQRKVLSGEVVPEHYNLRMDVREDGFGGLVGIKISIRRDTSTIVLNAKDLQIRSGRLEADGKTYQGAVSYKDETVVFSFGTPVRSTDDAYLQVEFDGKYNPGMDGFYRSDYNGKPIYSTHFEPTDARKAFPCFDQPDMKATFSISIDAEAEAVVLSNSSLRETRGRVRVFEKTKKMSTYLVAFVVGHLDYVETKTKRGVPIRVYADKDEVEWGRFALDVARHCVDYFEEYFAVEYVFPKIDMVAIPAFAMGAMENWGLITYRKTSLLYNKETTPVRSKKLIAETVCHELAHMWFGNLVTMQWWDDLWLNEGFATWAASMGVYNLPKDLIDWDVWTAFINSDVEAGMSYDALHSTHPIAVPVMDPNDINQIFDSISYSKGASLIRMIENHIGHEQFRDGIRSYLKEFKFANANTADLWRHVSGASEIASLVDHWVNREGFPLIKVEERGSKLVLSQSRFFMGTKAESGTWVIPVKINFIGKGTESFEFSGRTLEIEKKSDVYKLNEGSSGFYRVQYPEQNLNSLFEGDLSEANRLNLVNDVFALAFGSYQSIKDRLRLVQKYRGETNFEILSSVLFNLSKIGSIFYDDKDVLSYVQKLTMDLVGECARRVDLRSPGTTINDIALNALLVGTAVRCNDEVVVKKLENAWDAYKRDESVVSSEFRRSLHAVVVDSSFEDILRFYREGRTPEAKSTAIYALTQTRKLDNINFLLNNLSMFDPQDSHYLMSGLVLNYRFRTHVVEFVINNFQTLYNYVNNISLFNYVLECSLSSVSTPDMVGKVRAFLATVDYSGSDRTVRKIDEKIGISERFRSENRDLHLK